jgi:hypothetical protein
MSREQCIGGGPRGEAAVVAAAWGIMDEDEVEEEDEMDDAMHNAGPNALRGDPLASAEVDAQVCGNGK